MMDLMNSIAAASINLKASQVQQSYDISLTKKAMNMEEAMAEKMLEMMPQMPPKGQYIDVYV